MLPPIFPGATATGTASEDLSSAPLARAKDSTQIPQGGGTFRTDHSRRLNSSLSPQGHTLLLLSAEDLQTLTAAVK